MDVQQPLALLGGLSPAQFMRRHWHKKPLLVRQAIPGFKPLLARAELLELAGREGVESRFIQDKGGQWVLRHGPLARRSLPPLATPRWTALVQGVDLHHEGVHALMQQFRFVPEARLDDLMISYATDGGGVGPHFDNYDVFLLQAEGQRRWKIGQMCDADSKLLQHADLRILADFEQTDEWVLEPGDMLYLPPRLAHYGIAEDDCMTYSVGFRAPSAAEVLTHFTDFLAQFLPDEERYSDAGMAPISDPHQIQQEALDRLKALLTEHMSDERLLLTWFGQFMTEPRYPELVSGPEIEEADFLAALEDGAVLVRNPSARLAWSEVDVGLVLFASGQSRLLPAHLKELLRLICAADALHTDNLAPWLADEDGRTLVRELVQQGSLEFADE